MGGYDTLYVDSRKRNYDHTGRSRLERRPFWQDRLVFGKLRRQNLEDIALRHHGLGVALKDLVIVIRVLPFHLRLSAGVDYRKETKLLLVLTCSPG